MNDIIISILLVLMGLFVGITGMIFINYIRGNAASIKAKALLEKAEKEAARIKKDYLLEAKEEAFKNKNEIEREIKEKKNEIKEAEERLITREINMDRRDQTWQNRKSML